MARKHQRVKVGPGKGRYRFRNNGSGANLIRRMRGRLHTFFDDWLSTLEEGKNTNDPNEGEYRHVCLIGDPINFRTKALYHSQLIIPPLPISFEFNKYKEKGSFSNIMFPKSI